MEDRIGVWEEDGGSPEALPENILTGTSEQPATHLSGELTLGMTEPRTPNPEETLP
jgi:hypothetical protein